MKLRIIVLLAIAALAACHRQSGTAPAAVRAKPTVRAAAPAPGASREELTAGMVEAVAQGKSQAPVDLKFDLRERPREGQPLEVAIALLPQIAARSATVVVTGSDGLKIEPGEQQFEFPAVDAAQVYRHSIKVTPTMGGLYLLNLSVNLQYETTSDSRVFTVPILVANTVGLGSASSRSAAGAQAGTAAQHPVTEGPPGS